MSNLINWEVSEVSNAVNLNGIVTMEGKNKIIIIKVVHHTYIAHTYSYS